MIIVMTILLFFGTFMFDYEYNKDTKKFETVITTNADGSESKKTVATDKAKHYTILFNTFVFLQLFN